MNTKLQKGDRVGHLEIISEVGEGGFGTVYRARDINLGLDVALKLAKSAGDVSLVEEAKALGPLKHPNIARVLNAGEHEGRPYIYSDYVDGESLEQQLKRGTIPESEAAEIAASVAEALAYLHKNIVFHCDIKPGNILIDGSGKPILVDFGLALSSNAKRGLYFQGFTADYASPEQARAFLENPAGQNFLPVLTGQGDIFSLGIVLFEMLTGKLPFPAEHNDETTRQHEVLKLIATAPHPPNPRVYNQHISSDLVEICKKALQNDNDKRFAVASDFSTALRIFRSGSAHGANKSTSLQPTFEHGEFESPQDTLSLNDLPQIRSRGLRPFEEEDHEFFINMLAGPYGKDKTTPSNLVEWLDLVSTTDSTKAFKLGLIYGEAGCGKTSWVRAALIPKLRNVHPFYISADLQSIEDLSKTLRDHGCNFTNLKEQLREIVNGRGLGYLGKVLVIVDQAEHLLADDTSHRHLAEALSECDGIYAQGIIVARDPYHRLISFMHSVGETSIERGKNYLRLDALEIEHAKRVLDMFGRAHNKDPKPHLKAERQQYAYFLESAVEELAINNLVTCIHLTSFVEMMQFHPWTLDVLKELGGVRGVRSKFLSELIDSDRLVLLSKSEKYLVTEILNRLLPDEDFDGTGPSTSLDDLRTAFGSNDERSFNKVMDLLETRLKLIREEEADLNEANGQKSHKHYQISHAIFVEPIRNWIDRKRDADQRLLERCHREWKRNNRVLPTASDLWKLGRSKSIKVWSKSQKDMYRRALVRMITHRVLPAIGFCLLLLLVRHYHASEVQRLQDQLVENVSNVDLELKDAVDAYRTNKRSPSLRLANEFTFAENGSIRKLRLAIAAAKESSERNDSGAPTRYVARVFQDARKDDPSIELVLTAIEFDREYYTNYCANHWRTMLEGTDYSECGLLFAAAAPAQLAKILADDNVSNTDRRKLLVSLGKLNDRLSEIDQDILESVLGRYKNDGEPGTRSASEWLLRTWGIDQSIVTKQSANWVQCPNDHELVLVAATENAKLGAVPGNSVHPDADPWFINDRSVEKSRRKVAIKYSFYIATKEVTVSQFDAFFADYMKDNADQDPAVKEAFLARNRANLYTKWLRSRNNKNDQTKNFQRPSLPQGMVTWHLAAAYCNWMSEAHGLKKVFEQAKLQERYAKKLPTYKPKENWENLDGYRLPTEEEWEYACRSGLGSRWYFGNDPARITEYAWIANNSAFSSQEVGLKIPNSFGLFDTLGNVAEWCMPVATQSGTKIRLFGGTWSGPDFWARPSLRTAWKELESDKAPQVQYGFRIVRTVFE